MKSKIKYALSILILVLSVISSNAYAGSFATHVVLGDVIGKNVDTNTQAFLLGILSHAVLDSIDPHNYAPNWTNNKSIQADIDFILLEFFIAGKRLIEVWGSGDTKRMWGVIGAIAPDIIDGIYSLKCPRCWQKGELLLPWHKAEYGPSRRMSKNATMILSIAINAVF